jgi:translation initiation factor IF-1
VWVLICSQGGSTIAREDNLIRRDGVVTAAPNHELYKIDLGNGHEIMAYCSGRIRRHRIRILVGDRVAVEFSPYDVDQGRIVYRY